MTVPPGYRDRRYLDFVRRLPCCVCYPGILEEPWRHLAAEKISDPDHLPHPGKALGRKVPDALTIPLCRGHHEERARVYRRPDQVWESRDYAGRKVTINPWHVVARLRWAYEAGNPNRVGAPA